MTHRHRRNILLVVLALFAACAYSPAPPTAPSAAAAPSRVPVSFTIQALPLGQRAGATVNLQALAANGAWAELDATCTSTSGTFEQPRARSTSPTSLVLKGGVAPTTISCRTDNGLTAEASVDLSAWGLQILGFDEQWTEAGGSRTFFRFQAIAHQVGVPLTSRTLDWGDGTSEPWLTQTVGTSDQVFLHQYQGTGTFMVTPRIAWAGGQASTTVLIQRSCIVPTFCQTTWRLP